MKAAVFFTLFLLVACSTKERLLSIADVSRPTRAMLDSPVRVRGFAFFHSEEVLLCPEKSYASAPSVELNIAALFSTPADFAHREAFHAEFEKLSARYESKDVIVDGILRVGPYGMLQRPIVVIEVKRITEAHPTQETTLGTRP